MGDPYVILRSIFNVCVSEMRGHKLRGNRCVTVHVCVCVCVCVCVREYMRVCVSERVHACVYACMWWTRCGLENEFIYKNI